MLFLSFLPSSLSFSLYYPSIFPFFSFSCSITFSVIDFFPFTFPHPLASSSLSSSIRPSLSSFIVFSFIFISYLLITPFPPSVLCLSSLRPCGFYISQSFLTFTVSFSSSFSSFHLNLLSLLTSLAPYCHFPPRPHLFITPSIPPRSPLPGRNRWLSSAVPLGGFLPKTERDRQRGKRAREKACGPCQCPGTWACNM